MSIRWTHERGDDICYESWFSGSEPLQPNVFHIARHSEPGECVCGPSWRDVEHYVLSHFGNGRTYHRFTLAGAQRLAEQIAAGQPE